MQTRPLLVLAALAAAGEPDFGRATIERLKSGLRERYADDPIGTTVSAALLAGLFIARAERGQNPKIRGIYDALVYVTSRMSGADCDIQVATTEAKALGAALAAFGPAMTTHILDAPSGSDDPRQRAIVERLDRIVAALEARAAASSPATAIVT